ncbi:MAG: TIGR01621 family pseudouridine synthase [Deltaproteobacteria bacterium]|nr:TIGR01621 family pseudouridine synthase [Deltaproteobacteria bacterium]
MYRIINNHEDFLLINKSSGVIFHKGSETEGLLELLKKEAGIMELHAVHRLDKVTSGLLLFAKNIDTAKDISRQFRNRLVEKYYIALSDRKPRKKQGLIKGDMGKARRGAWKLLRTMNNPAVTQFFSCSAGNNMRLFIIRPRTGKTHQVRVALKSIGSPVLGDPLYHGKEEGLEIDRTYLHSYALSFTVRDKE